MPYIRKNKSSYISTVSSTSNSTSVFTNWLGSSSNTNTSNTSYNSGNSSGWWTSDTGTTSSSIFH